MNAFDGTVERVDPAPLSPTLLPFRFINTKHLRMTFLAAKFAESEALSSARCGTIRIFERERKIDAKLDCCNEFLSENFCK